ncbi:MAG: acetylxylan esterase [Acidobacteria bacterium]|nr:acetylxylan esterase [Acidobacteriota bacterium]
MISRRNLALAAITPAVMAKAQKPAPKHPEPNYDVVAWGRQRWEQAPRKMRFQAKTAKQARSWQKKLRAKMVELVGGFPARTPLKARILETREFAGYTRETIVFESRPGLEVFAYLLLPKNGPRPAPVTLCIPGHGRGVDDIVGIAEDGSDRTVKAGYQYDYAIQAVEQGLAAFAVEPIGFGHRRGEEARKQRPGTSSCQPAAGAALLYGETMIGWRVWDMMRAIDYLETRKEVDSARVGCMGISGGGTITMYTAALDTRVRAALVSGYLCMYRDSILSLSHCMDNYVPGVLNWAEASDIAGLVAPRALFSESGEKDNIFPVAGARQAFEEAKKVYEVMGAGDQCELEIHPRDHQFWGRQGLPFLARQLKA